MLSSARRGRSVLIPEDLLKIRDSGHTGMMSPQLSGLCGWLETKGVSLTAKEPLNTAILC